MIKRISMGQILSSWHLPVRSYGIHQGLIQDFEVGGGKEKKEAISVRAEVGGSGGMPPQENFEKWAL